MAGDKSNDPLDNGPLYVFLEARHKVILYLGGQLRPLFHGKGRYSTSPYQYPHIRIQI